MSSPSQLSKIHPPMLPPKPSDTDTNPDSISDSLTHKPIQLQRRRVWRACESCRRKKIKCDGHEPTCGQCVAARLNCQWSQTKDRAALSRHYVQELEARLLHMESLLNQMNAENRKRLDGQSVSTSRTPDLSASTPTAAAKPSSPAVSSSASPSVESDKVKREEPEMTEQFGQLALDEHGHGRFLGTSSTIALISSFRALTNSGPDRASPGSPSDDGLAPPSMSSLYFPGSVMFGKTKALPPTSEVVFPEPEIADALIDAYFARYHLLVPILDKSNFLRDYQALHERLDLQADASFLSVVFAVYACAARLVGGQRAASEDTGLIYYERALVLHYISHAQPQTAHVQCFVLLASFLCSANCLPQAWLLVGQAIRTAQDLGLHRSPRKLPISPIEKETRRKIWWNVYCLDRMLAVALGRPLGIDDLDCDVELPVDLDDEELPIYFSGNRIDRAAPSLMTGFVALAKLYIIAGRLLRQVYALRFCREDLGPEVVAELQNSVDDLDHQLDEWCEELPACFKSQPVNDSQISMGAVLCSSWYAIRITLHRNFLPIKRDATPPPISSSASKAVSAARSCIFLASSIKSVIPPSHHLAFFIQYLFSSAVIILLCAVHATEEGAAAQAMREAQSCLNALEELEGVWPGATKCKELLSELSSVAMDTMRNEAAKFADPPSSLFHPPMVRPPIPPLAHMPPPNSGALLSTDFSRPSHRTVKAKHTAHSKKRSMSQKRPREGEGSGDYGSHSSNAPDRERVSRTRRKSIGHRSPSAVRNTRTAQNNQSSLYVDTVSLDQASQALSNSRPTYELPLSPSVGTVENAGNWTQASSGWDPSNTSHPHLEETPIDYPALSAYGGYNFGSTDIGEPNIDMANNGTTFMNPFDSEGLPFAGLQLLHSYNPQNAELDTIELWNSLGPSAFDYGPEIPFALPEGNSEGQHH